MKRKLVLLVVTCAMGLAACGSTSTTTAPSADVPAESSSVESSVAQSIQVEEKLFDVTVTLPASYSSNVTQEDLDKTAEQNGYKSATLNADGTITYVMSNKRYEEALNEYKESVNKSLSEMIGSESYPNFTDISVNDDCTEFTVTTKSTKLDLNESFSAMSFYMLGGFYNAFAGNSDTNIHVVYVNADSGEIISEANSSELGK